MKPKINREIKIGLSVLLLLMLILVGVIVRRFVHAAPLETEVARAEEKHDEKRRDEPLKLEAESFAKPAIVTPVETSHLNAVRSPGDPGHWNTESKKRKEDVAANYAAGLIGTDPPAIAIPPEKPKPQHRDEQRPAAALDTGLQTPPDDRYAPAANERADHAQRERAGSMVIQVSGGETGDGTPRPMDRYAPAASQSQSVQPTQFGPGDRPREALPPAPRMNDPVSPSGDRLLQSTAAQSPADADIERHRIEKERAEKEQFERERTQREAADRLRSGSFREAGATAEVPAPRANYVSDPPAAARDSRSGYDPTRQQSVGNANYDRRDPAMNSTPNYTTPPSGYAPERLQHQGHEGREARDDLGPARSRIPLRNDGMYEVQPNDSYWTISQQIYGSGAYFRALAEQNRGKAARPDRLPPGLLISTPPVAQLEKDFPDLCPRPNRRDTIRNRAATAMASTPGGGRTYVVQEGDTLSSIVRNELGKVSRWAEIYQLNREALGKDYDYLTPGMRLVLPIRDSQPSDRTTRRDDSGMPLTR